MTYHVKFSKNAIKQLKKLDIYTSALIIGWIKNLEVSSNPRSLTKGLVSNISSQW